VGGQRTFIANAWANEQRGQNAELRALMEDLADPPIDEIGALPIDSFFKKTERRALAAALNTLIASPTFSSWRQGASLDVAEWLGGGNGRTNAVVVSVAHLDDEDRALVLGLLLKEILCWVRGLGGSRHLRALVIFDEVFGFLPPHPANPPTKRPLVALMKQARAFGVHPRETLSLMRGPMTRDEIQRARELRVIAVKQA
jgi:hypothetical protein